MQIHYAILGEGPPLVLLHKLGGWIADWRHVAPALARHHRVIAFDSPGHGDSVVQGKVPYLLSLPESAAILLSVLDELGIERFSLVGNSLGGCIGVCMAALWPARIERLGLLSVALYPVIPRAALDGLEPAGTWGPNDAPLPRPFAEQQKRFGMKDIAIYDEQVASRAKAGPWVRAAQRGVAAGGVIDYLARVTAPTLLMYGERGSDYQQYEKPGLATAKHARSVHIPDAGAFAQMDNPRATEEIILEFLAEP
jgi:pimeloyl-ACP methyl ester carboxylesterase